MATQTLTAKITKHAGNGKGFQLEEQEGWFNANDKTIPFLAKLKDGTLVEISYIQKGVKREVTLIKETSGVTAEAPKETPKEDDKGMYTNCSVCGKELKGKGVNYPKCWDCKDAVSKEEKKSEEPRKEKIHNAPITDKDVQIQRGNSLNSASAVLKGNFEGTNTDIETIKQATLHLAESFLDWLRCE